MSYVPNLNYLPQKVMQYTLKNKTEKLSIFKPCTSIAFLHVSKLFNVKWIQQSHHSIPTSCSLSPSIHTYMSTKFQQESSPECLQNNLCSASTANYFMLNTMFHNSMLLNKQTLRTWTLRSFTEPPTTQANYLNILCVGVWEHAWVSNSAIYLINHFPYCTKVLISYRKSVD